MDVHIASALLRLCICLAVRVTVPPTCRHSELTRTSHRLQVEYQAPHEQPVDAPSRTTTVAVVVDLTIAEEELSVVKDALVSSLAGLAAGTQLCLIRSPPAPQTLPAASLPIRHAARCAGNPATTARASPPRRAQTATGLPRSFSSYVMVHELASRSVCNAQLFPGGALPTDVMMAAVLGKVTPHTAARSNHPSPPCSRGTLSISTPARPAAEMPWNLRSPHCAAVRSRAEPQ